MRNPVLQPPEELPADLARSTLTGRRRGLRKLSPDLLSKASDETAKQVTRIGLTFFTTAAFCVLSLFSPDSALLGGNEKINVPLAGPVSFSGFMLLGPAVLIVLRIYLQIYVDHGDRLDRLAQRIPVVGAPTLVPLKVPLIRIFNALLFYLLLPVAIVFFAWKAAVFPAWGSSLLCVATSYRQPSHAAIQQDLLAIKGVAEPQRGDNCRRGSVCWVSFVWFRAASSSIRFGTCKPVRSLARGREFQRRQPAL